MRRKWKWPLVVVGVLVLGPIFVALFGFAILNLWNWLMPGIFGLREITFWQAVGLFVLARLLFGGRSFGGRSRHRGPGMRERWRRMTPEERDRFVRGMKGRCEPVAPEGPAPNG